LIEILYSVIYNGYQHLSKERVKNKFESCCSGEIATFYLTYASLIF